MKKLLIIVALMLVLSTGIAYGACTFANPSGSSDVLRGSEVINATCAAGDDAVNCTVTASSANSPSSDQTIELYNHTDSGLNATFDTTSVVDASDWSFSGSCVDASSTEISLTTVSGVDIDNTAPTCSFDSAFTSDSTVDPSTEWEIEADNATSAKVRFGSNSWHSMTESSADVFTVTPVPPESRYTVYGESSDGLNTTSCTSLTNVEIQASNVKQIASSTAGFAKAANAELKKQADQDQTQDSGSSNKMLYLAAVGLLLFYLYKKKK